MWHFLSPSVTSEHGPGDHLDVYADSDNFAECISHASRQHHYKLQYLAPGVGLSHPNDIQRCNCFILWLGGCTRNGNICTPPVLKIYSMELQKRVEMASATSTWRAPCLPLLLLETCPGFASGIPLSCFNTVSRSCQWIGSCFAQSIESNSWDSISNRIWNCQRSYRAACIKPFEQSLLVFKSKFLPRDIWAFSTGCTMQLCLLSGFESQPSIFKQCVPYKSKNHVEAYSELDWMTLLHAVRHECSSIWSDKCHASLLYYSPKSGRQSSANSSTHWRCRWPAMQRPRRTSFLGPVSFTPASICIQNHSRSSQACVTYQTLQLVKYIYFSVIVILQSVKFTITPVEVWKAWKWKTAACWFPSLYLGYAQTQYRFLTIVVAHKLIK